MHPVFNVYKYNAGAWRIKLNRIYKSFFRFHNIKIVLADLLISRIFNFYIEIILAAVYVRENT